MVRTSLLSVFALAWLAACGGSDPGDDKTAATAEPDAVEPTEAVGLTVENVVGEWSGTLKVPNGTTLPLVIDLADEDGSLVISMDSPAQGAFGIAGENARIDEGALKADFPVIGATFTAEKGEGDTLNAVWQQGVAMPLTLTRGAEVEMPPRPQEPTARDYVIEEVRFDSVEGVTLAGELTLPRGDGPFPGLVLITGSGPQNRNEELLGHKPFLVLSDYLTRRGFAVLRYDDRGVGESTGDHSVATSADFADDAAAALAFLRTDARIDKARTAYVGHSEGGIIAPLAAGTEQPDAMVLLAGPSQTLAEVAVFQTGELMRADGATDAAADAAQQALSDALDLLRGSDDLDAVRAQTEQLYIEAGLPEAMARSRAEFTATPWMKWGMDHDPIPSIESFDGPVLALFGERDLQVAPSENVADMRRALSNPASEVVVLDGLNHLFQPARTGSVSEYAQIEITFDEQAMETVAAWLDTVFAD